MDEPRMCYVGKRACGCVEMAIVDTPEISRDVAKEVAKALRRGLTVERVSVEWVRKESRWECDECKPRKREGKVA